MGWFNGEKVCTISDSLNRHQSDSRIVVFIRFLYSFLAQFFLRTIQYIKQQIGFKKC